MLLKCPVLHCFLIPPSVFLPLCSSVRRTHRRFERSVALISIKIPAPLAELRCVLSHRVLWSHGVMSRKLCNVRTVSINACSDRTVSSLSRVRTRTQPFLYEHRVKERTVGGRTHACTSKHQLWDNKLWLWNQIENVVKYERRETCVRQIKRHRLHPAPVLSFALAAPTRCPVNRPGPAARLNATTCNPRVSAYASLGLISSDKSNISGVFAPLGLTCRMTPICAILWPRGHVTPWCSPIQNLSNRPTRTFSCFTITKAYFFFFFINKK